MSDTDEQNLNDLSIDELADRLYVSLWHRNATLGVDQTEVVEALFENLYHLPELMTADCVWCLTS
jgi:hypothetical protein